MILQGVRQKRYSAAREGGKVSASLTSRTVPFVTRGTQMDGQSQQAVCTTKRTAPPAL